MSIAITDEHRALAQTVSDFLAKRGARGAARALLEAEHEELPAFWRELSELGWLGLHIPEEHGGSGFGLPELVIVAEEMGRAVAPGPVRPDGDGQRGDRRRRLAAGAGPLLPGLADGSVIGAVALGGEVSVSGGDSLRAGRRGSRRPPRRRAARRRRRRRRHRRLPRRRA